MGASIKSLNRSITVFLPILTFAVATTLFAITNAEADSLKSIFNHSRNYQVGIPLPNKPPLLEYTSPHFVLFGGSLRVTPRFGLSDDQTVTNVQVLAVFPRESNGAFTGTITVDNSGDVFISNAGPLGSYNVLIQATDNNGASTLTRFTFRVSASPCPNYEHAPGSPFPYTGPMRSFGMGDFNGDNRLDLAIELFSLNQIAILLSDGSGGFTEAPGSPFAAHFPDEIEVCDFNRDGVLDLVTLNDGSFSIFLGNGNGSFSPTSQSPFDLPGLVDVSDLSLADFNNDGRVDIALTVRQTPNAAIHIFLNHPLLGLVEASGSPITPPNDPFEIEAGDFDNDGNIDFVVFLNVLNASTDTLRVYYGDGSGGFSTNILSSIIVGDLGLTTLVADDFNGDGYSDVALLGKLNAGDILVSVFLGNDSVTLSPASGPPLIFPSILNISDAIASDVDLDGKKDIIFSQSHSTGVALLFGDGTGAFSFVPSSAVAFPSFMGTSSRIAAGDINNDARPDIVLIGPLAGKINTLVSKGCGPEIAPAGPLARSRCGAGSVSTIATVRDDDSPPGNLPVTAQSVPAGISVTNIVNQNGQVSALVSASPAAALGGNTVVLKVQSPAGLFKTANLLINVTDDAVPPTIGCSSNITKSTDPNQCSTSVNYAVPVGTDDCSATVNVICDPPPGSTFQKGATTVTCRATDESGNQASCSFSVTVVDAQPPTITYPGNIMVSTDVGQCSAIVSYDAPPVSDNCSGVGVPVCNPPSGSAFPKGMTTVNCAATDASGNTSSGSFTVTVNDTEPPTIICPSSIVTTAASGQSFAMIDYTIIAADNCPGVTVAASPPSGSSFPIGTTLVTATAADASGNTATCSFTVTVNEDICNVISNVSVSPSQLWPPNHKMKLITVNYTVADSAGPVTCTLSVTSNEPINGAGDGDTAPDWEIVDSHHVRLRAERAGTGNGRVYMITITCTNNSGSTCTKTVTVRVPHNG